MNESFSEEDVAGKDPVIDELSDDLSESDVENELAQKRDELSSLDGENIDDVLVVNSDTSDKKSHFDKKEKKIHVNESSYDIICESMQYSDSK